MEAVVSLSSISISSIVVCCMCLFIINIRKRKADTLSSGYVTENWDTKAGTPTTTGPWTSPSYGSMRDNPYGRSCAEGEYITDVIGFHGQGEHTNALQAWCYNPKTKKTTRIFKNPTCGKRDKHDHLNSFMIALTPILAIAATAITIISGGSAAVVWVGVAATAAGTAASVGTQIASGIDAHKDVLNAGAGRKMWDVVWSGSPYGFNKWSTRAKDGEIQGLKLDGTDGEVSTDWIGGGTVRVNGPAGPRLVRAPSGKVVTQSCPTGYVVTGIEATCGDRVDGIRFVCNRPGGSA